MPEKTTEPELKTKIFAKALAMFEAGKVVPDGETDRVAYFLVEGEHEKYRVRVASDGTFNCTCMRGTMQGATRGAICSHVLAAMLHLVRRSDRKC